MTTRAIAALRWAAWVVVTTAITALAITATFLAVLPDSGPRVAAMMHCPLGFLSCYDGECLRQSKFCDGHQDCRDNSDETDCDAPCHPPDYFRCHNGKCIGHLFVCDGEDECGDGSDERDCHNDSQMPAPICHEKEFKCGDNLCIPDHWKCDGEHDCLDGSDETIGCTNQSHCDGKGTFLCANHHCIPEEWRCDGHDDCTDNSDEIGCSPREPSGIPTPTCPIQRGLYPCENHVECAELTELCDEKNDCSDGSDEGAGCNDSRTRCKTFGCRHKCIATPDKPLCICPKGFNTSQVKNCIDIDECSQYGICTHRCKNLPGSYQCECAPGYVLQVDNTTCKASGASPLLVFSMKTEIRAMHLNRKDYYPVIKEEQHVAGVAYDGRHMYWTTTVNGEEAIVRSNEDGSDREVIVTSGIASPEDLAVDSLTGNIYFTDSEMKHIGVCTNDGKACTVIVNDEVDNPQAIVLYITRGEMFWTDWGKKPMVAKAGMDGSSPTEFVSEHLKWPNGLALDVNNGRLYWADAKSQLVESINLDGSDRREILSEVVKNPYALAVFEEKLYWSDFKTSEILSCNKFTGKNIEKVVYSRNNYFYALHIYHPSMYFKNTTNPCDNAPCSDVCLLAPNLTHTCACPENKILKEDKHTCRDIEKNEGLAIGGGNKLVLMTHQALGKQDLSSMTFNTIDKIGALAYHNILDSIFISDIVKKEISIVQLKSSTLRPLVSHEIGTVQSISYDHLADNVYWCDSERGTVEVMSLSTLQRATLYRGYGDQTPVAVVVVPEEGVMFVALKKSHGQHPFHIDKMNMDGAGGVTHFLETNIEGPGVSLAYDKQRNELIIADSGRGSIESTELDGTHHNPMQSLTNSPMSVTTLGNDLFWTSKESTHLYWSYKMKRYSKVKRLPLGMFNAEDSVVLASVKGTIRTPDHPCRKNNGGCSHLCLVSSHKMVCVCPEDHVLKSDNKTCTIPTHCARQQFKCERDNKCIPLSQRCDGHDDCVTNEDEMDCPIPCHSNEFECSNGQCIFMTQRCDDKIQCIDGSDEYNCHTEPCTDDQFECNSGECINQGWRCDLRKDCKDGSDEEECDRAVCPAGKFRCKSGTCIPSTWECDHEVNCADGSDEHEGCPPITCFPEDYICKNKRCVDKTLQCNQLDDCGDNSDEEDCKQIELNPLRCNENDFRCTETNMEILCLPMSARCNGSAECPKGDDELGCGCSSTEFECDFNRCIEESWVCDGSFDCDDRSDEEPRLCDGENSPTWVPCHGHRCNSGQCIDISQACNGIADCSDGSDEGGKCNTACNHENPCEDVCNPTPSGPKCSCHPGFLMRAESSICIDDDECSQNLCSHICDNTQGSFICSCAAGYSLRSDRMSCKAEGKEMQVLFVANGNEIRIAPFSLQRISVFHQEAGINIVGLDVNIPKKIVYWSTERGSTIFYKSLEDKITNNATGLGRPKKIAVDWITENIYFTDETHDDQTWIKVCNFKVQKCAEIVAARKGSKVDNLVIDPISGYIFWTEGNGDSDGHYVIKRTDLTGYDLFTLVRGLSYVGGLTADLIHHWLFWADHKEAIVGAVGYHGENRHVAFDKGVKLVSGLALFEDSLYWVSYEMGRLVKCRVFGERKTCEWVQLNSHNVKNFALVQEQRQIKVENKCQQKQCSHMCISGATNPACICPDGTIVHEDDLCINATSTIPNMHIIPEGPKTTNVPIAGIFMITMCLIIALAALGYLLKGRLRFSTPDFSRSVRFITSPYSTIKKATTGSTKLDSKTDMEEEMEDVLHKESVKTAAPPAPASTPENAGTRRTLQFRISDLQSSDEETDFSSRDTTKLIP